MFNQDWKEDLPDGFPDGSRVWIYQSSKPFSEEEKGRIIKSLEKYVQQWISHNRPVKGWATVLFDQFILIMADDTRDRLCGSAIDDSFRFIKKLEVEFGISLLDRMKMGFLKEEKIQIIPLNEVEDALNLKKLDENSLFFNNGILTKGELLSNWIIPLKKSFLKQRIVSKVS